MKFQSNVFKFSYNETECEMREPSSGEHMDFAEKHDKCGDDTKKALKIMQDFYIDLGLDEKVCKEMPIRVLAEIGKLIGGDEKK